MKRYLLCIAFMVLCIMTSCNKSQKPNNISHEVVIQEYDNNIVDKVEEQNIVIELNKIEYDGLLTNITLTFSYDDLRKIDESQNYQIIPELRVDDEVISNVNIKEPIFNDEKTKLQFMCVFNADIFDYENIGVEINSVLIGNNQITGIWNFNKISMARDVYLGRIEINEEIYLANNNKCKFKKLTFSENGVFLETESENDESYIIIGRDKCGSKYYFIPYYTDEESCIYACNVFENKMLSLLKDFSKDVSKIEVEIFDAMKISMEGIEMTSEEIDIAKISKEAYSINLNKKVEKVNKQAETNYITGEVYSIENDSLEEPS